MESGQAHVTSFAVRCKRQPSVDVGSGELRKIINDFGFAHSRHQLAENIPRGDAHSANARSAAPLAGFDGEKLEVRRSVTMRPADLGQPRLSRDPSRIRQTNAIRRRDGALAVTFARGE